MSGSLTILHASDLQCGRPYSVRAAEAFVAFARELEPDVVVVSGDLTQRAKAREFKVAVELMGRLPDVPKVVTPGNHDVPLFRIAERIFAPYKNWKRLVQHELDKVTRVEGATFVALNSSAPRTQVVNGRLSRAQLDYARRAFEQAAPGDVRALVIHHHFVHTPDRTGGQTLPRGREHLAVLEAMGVDLVLGGHVHRTHVRTSRELLPGDADGVPLIACGTTTSRRGRGPEAGINSLNVVRVGSREVHVHPHVLVQDADHFEPRDAIVLARGRAAAVASGGVES